jgi:hypothetical protein
MDFEIEKRAKFAIVGKVPIQLGRNTTGRRPGGHDDHPQPADPRPQRLHPLPPGLKTKVEAFQAYLKGSGVYAASPSRTTRGSTRASA